MIEPEDECCFCAQYDPADLFVTTVSPINPTISCFKDEYKCSDHSKCILKNNQCDGISDCSDGSDEKYCTECLLTEWTSWSVCSQSCDVGVRVKTREVYFYWREWQFSTVALAMK